MKSSRRLRRAGLCLAALTLQGCGDDRTVHDGDAATRNMNESVEEKPACVEAVHDLISGSSGSMRERVIRDYFLIGAPPQPVYLPPCSFEAVIMAADALPMGETRVELLLRAAIWDSLPNSTPDRRRMVAGRLRALLPKLEGDMRKVVESELAAFSSAQPS
ncbi:MAG: hypothetical protein WA978_13865 [Sphingopyxis granuli]|jgi:hypothetical protein|uniref:hypothetical protein n=1 Tax=Sphingopyxis granuli TaxID=267128 RepID=UPI003C76C436